jgi:uncharacterized OsmC-like protein
VAGLSLAKSAGIGQDRAMGSYEASVETADDGSRGEPNPLVVEFRNARTGQRQRFAFDAFTGGHLLHLSVAGCVYNDLFREAAARGITLTHVSVSADGGFAGEPCVSTGVGYRIHVEGDASTAELEQLVAHVEEIAEVPSAIRVGAEVRLLTSEVASTRD